MPDQLTDPFGDREPSRELKTRVVRTLLASGLVESRAARLKRRVVRSSLLLAAMVAGFVAGRIVDAPRAAPDDRPTFVLLLYNPAEYRDDRPEREIVAEYTAWADSLRRVGSLVLADRLADRATTYPAGAPADVPSGFFIVRAADLREAAAMTESSPHLRYGGRILLTEIDRR